MLNSDNVGPGLIEVSVLLILALLLIDVVFTCIAMLLGFPAWPA